MIDCYSVGTVNGQRVVCMLEETGLAYRPHWIDFHGGEHRTPEFLAINPRGRMPVIIDPNGPGGGRFVLNQSMAIVQYLADKTGQFLPREGEARYLCLQWLSFAITDIAPAAIALFFLRDQVEESKKAIAVFRKRTEDFLADANTRLGANEYLAGSEMTVADICLYPSLVMPQAAAILDETPALTHLRRWRDMMAARPAMDRGMKACPPPVVLHQSRKQAVEGGA